MHNMYVSTIPLLSYEHMFTPVLALVPSEQMDGMVRHSTPDSLNHPLEC